VASYVIAQGKCQGVERYPLVMMLETAFRCNLACAGCGKIQFRSKFCAAISLPKTVLQRGRGVRRADGLDPGGEAMAAPQIDTRSWADSLKRKEIQLPLPPPRSSGKGSTSSRRR